MQINPYQKKLKIFLEKVKNDTSIAHLRGPYKNGETPPTATWEDKAWQYQNNKGQIVSFGFVEVPAKLKFMFKCSDNFTLLPLPMHELLKAYALHLIGTKVSEKTKGLTFGLARKFVSKTDLFLSYSVDAISTFVDNEEITDDSYLRKINKFVRWLKDHQLIPQNIQEYKHKREALTGDELLKKRSEKLPDEKAILALGAIQYQVIPQNKSKWNTHPLDCQRDAFICSMTALALSSPNRVAAEQTVVTQQKLKMVTQEIKGKKKTVHYLDWSGSKGFDDNKNHILSSMASTVEHVLDYLDKVTEPNRVIARFYKDPNTSLKVILGSFAVSKEKWQAARPDINKPTNMFVLGYLLGFYDKAKIQATQVRVICDTPNAVEVKVKRGKGYSSRYYKSIHLLQSDDVVIINSKPLTNLLAMGNNQALGRFFGWKGNYSVANIQQRWRTYIKSINPTFPELRNDTADGKCDAEYRLFSLNGMQLELRVGGVKAQKSPYFVVSPATLADIYQSDLSNTRGKSIFQRHGFSAEFKLEPNQFRHYLNDTADRNGLPRAVINMWSGRSDPNQIIHYVHSTDDERAESIIDILYNEDGLTVEKAKQSICLISRDEYTNVTGEVASVTSSGICTQNLMVTPCQFLNDFNVQCVFCSKSCHVAHDDKTVALFKEDMKVQISRLNKVSMHPSFVNSEAMQSWYKLHLSNTEKLNQLIELMTDTEVEKGALIRMLVDKNEFRISNLKNKKIEIRKLALPDTKEALKLLLKGKQKDDKDEITEKLLRLI